MSYGIVCALICSRSGFMGELYPKLPSCASILKFVGYRWMVKEGGYFENFFSICAVVFTVATISLIRGLNEFQSTIRLHHCFLSSLAPRRSATFSANISRGKSIQTVRLSGSLRLFPLPVGGTRASAVDNHAICTGGTWWLFEARRAFCSRRRRGYL
jgi:hypothetical protein